MTYTHIVRGLLLTTLLVPMATFAYTSPEEVLNSDENAGFYNPPPSPRHTQEIQAQQQASVAAWRAAQQQALFEKSSASSAAASEDTDPFFHGAAPTEPTYGQTSGISATDQRILERVKAQQQQAEMDAAIEARVRVLTSQQGLHSGAPLADSGPGTIISAFVLAGAGLWTIWKAKRLEKAQD